MEFFKNYTTNYQSLCMIMTSLNSYNLINIGYKFKVSLPSWEASSQSVKKFLVVYNLKRFTTIFTCTHHWTLS
jgi:hypothetical protein